MNFNTESLSGEDAEQPKGFRQHLGHWLVRVQNGQGDLTKGPGLQFVNSSVVDGTHVQIFERRWVAYYNLDIGHVLALWKSGGHTFEISIHGFENRNLVLPMAKAMIEQIDQCSATGGGRDASQPCQLVFPASGSRNKAE